MLLIDASVYIFRAFHALPASITGRGGRPLNAIHGYATFITNLLAQARTQDTIAAAFDESLTQSFRNDLFAGYKTNREQPPAGLIDQIAACRELTEALGVAILSKPRFEADDLIGTLAAGTDSPVTIVTSDKDLAQLLRGHDVLWDYARSIRYDRDAIQQRFGVAAERIPDYLALVGDRVDNIPGVPGIGAKTAADLLARYQNLETMLAALDGLRTCGLRAAKSLADKLEAGRDQARLSKRLATIVTDIDLEDGQRDITRRPPDRDRLSRLCDELGGGDRLRRQLGIVEDDKIAR